MRWCHPKVVVVDGLGEVSRFFCFFQGFPLFGQNPWGWSQSYFHVYNLALLLGLWKGSLIYRDTYHYNYSHGTGHQQKSTLADTWDQTVLLQIRLVHVKLTGLGKLVGQFCSNDPYEFFLSICGICLLRDFTWSGFSLGTGETGPQTCYISVVLQVDFALWCDVHGFPKSCQILEDL